MLYEVITVGLIETRGDAVAVEFAETDLGQPGEDADFLTAKSDQLGIACF